MSRSRGLALVVLGLVACAPEVVHRPTQLTPITEAAGGTIEVLAEVPLTVGSGYRRVIRPGDHWTRIGRILEGEVYKPVDRVFTVEGAQVHEAYLVLEGDRVVGFYLPVERAFSPMPNGGSARLSFRRRDP
jgi:hypothetical protein